MNSPTSLSLNELRLEISSMAPSISLVRLFFSFSRRLRLPADFSNQAATALSLYQLSREKAQGGSIQAAYA